MTPIDAVFALFDTYGGSSYDESVTLTEHCLQTAANAEAAGAGEALIAAALLHDVGHFLLTAERGDENYLDATREHEVAGERYLATAFGPEVARPVGLHVPAKRYLCATDPAYHDALSEASKMSLAVQGGAFDETQCEAFERLPGWKEGVAVRRWDDLGKQPGTATRDLGDYRPLLGGLLIAGT